NAAVSAAAAAPLPGSCAARSVGQAKKPDTRRRNKREVMAQDTTRHEKTAPSRGLLPRAQFGDGGGVGADRGLGQATDLRVAGLAEDQLGLGDGRFMGNNLLLGRRSRGKIAGA